MSVGEVCGRLLYGEINPSGRLAETFLYCVRDRRIADGVEL